MATSRLFSRTDAVDTSKEGSTLGNRNRKRPGGMGTKGKNPGQLPLAGNGGGGGHWPGPQSVVKANIKDIPKGGLPVVKMG